MRISQWRRVFPWLWSVPSLIVFVVMGLSFVKGFRVCIAILDWNNPDTIAAFVFSFVVLVGIWFLVLVELLYMRSILLLQRTKIAYWGDYFSFQYRNNNQLIKCSEILYAWKGSVKITIVIKKREQVWSYSFLNMIYGRKMLKKIESVLREKDVFLDDSKQIRKAVKEFKMDDLFRKNRFEYFLRNT
jgi:hypothetical protein